MHSFRKFYLLISKFTKIIANNESEKGESEKGKKKV